MLKTKFKVALTALVLLAGFGSTALAAEPAFFPVNSAVNPVSGALYTVNNDVANNKANPMIRVYKRDSNGGWFTNYGTISLAQGEQCYGLAVSPAGDTLYASIYHENVGAEVRVYPLDVNTGGQSGQISKMTGDSWPVNLKSMPAGLVVGGNNRLFVADYTLGRFLVYNTQTKTYIKSITDPHLNAALLHSIAVTPPALFGSYKIFISQKGISGKIFAFTYAIAGDTITYKATISADVYRPTYLKVVDGQLYAAVNGANGVDVKVYKTGDYFPVGDISSGVNAFYGWTGFDISQSGKWLFFKKATGNNETINKLYKVDLSQGLTPVLITDQITKADGIAISLDLINVGLSYSPNGSKQFVKLPGFAPPATVTNFNASDGEDEKSTLTWNNPSDTNLAEVLVARVTDNPTIEGDSEWPSIDGSGKITKGIEVYRNTSPVPGAAVSIVDTGLSNAPYIYQYIVFSSNTEGIWNTTNGLNKNPKQKNADYGNPDDTIPPEAIDDLVAVPGANKGEVKLTFTAPGDNGTIGTVAGYLVRYIAGTGDPYNLNPPPFGDGFEDPDPPSTYYLGVNNWNNFVAGGQTEVRTLEGLPHNPGTPTYVWVAMIAKDETNVNWDGISNLALAYVKDSVPVPVITQVYPNKAPVNTTQDLVIEGSGFWGTPKVELTGNGTIAAGGVSVVNQNKIICSVNLNAANLGLYNVVVTNPNLDFAAASNSFEVIAAGSDLAAPSIVTNFKASDNEDQKSTLTWTNPADGDLREVVIRRKEGAYPANHSDGTVVYTSLTPKPSAAGQVIDPGLTKDTTYYYAVFSKDTSSNWNDNVDSTAPGVNADTGTPGTGGGNDPVVNLVITRTGDTPGSDIKITWDTNPPGLGVDVYQLICNTDANGEYTSYFTTVATSWNKIATNIQSPYTTQNQVGTGTAVYYKLIATNGTLKDSDLTTNVVGKFDLAVGPGDVYPERAIISLPLELSDYSITSVFGNQANEADSIALIDNAYSITSSMNYENSTWVPGSGTPLSTLAQGPGYVYTTLTAKFITIVGKLRETNGNKTINTGLDSQQQFIIDWIGNSFPAPVSVSTAGLNSMSFGPDSLSAAAVQLLDGNGAIVGGAAGYAEHRTASNWVDSDGQAATLQLLPGKGYVVTDPLIPNYGWNQPKI